MGIQNLAECIILQSLIDISEPSENRESVNFFMGRRLVDCARIAGMNGDEISSLRKFARLYILRARASGKLSGTVKPVSSATPKARKTGGKRKTAAKPLSPQCVFQQSMIAKGCGI